MKIKRSFALAGLLACLPSLSGAYELRTHEDLSDAAAQASVLRNQDTLSNLGIEKPIGDFSQTFPNSKNERKRIVDLIRDGANFEDTITNSRALNHFFNPLSGRGLTFLGVEIGLPSPDWALANPGSVNNQTFSYLDARKYFYEALTKSGQTERERSFGLTFQTLGHVMHHLQDMAQPQHVRNDPHCDSIFPCLIPGTVIGAFNPSLYEKWTDQDQVRNALPFTGYVPTFSAADLATFNAPRNFWHTLEGKGIADFTNRNFVSAGTNFDKPGLFPSPVFDENNRLDIDIQQLCVEADPPCLNPNLSGPITFYGNLVDDKLTGATVNNPFASSLSIFDADLRKESGGNVLTQPRVFTLNRFNFSLAHAFLIPRAVGYSAGLINYFFRGRIDILPNPDPNNPGSFIIKNLGNEDMSGNFTLYYDAVDGTRNPIAGAINGTASTGSVTWPNLTIPAQGQSSEVLTFTPPSSPAPKTPIVYTLVFNGDMGEEKADALNGVVGAVVGKVFAPVPPWQFFVTIGTQQYFGKLSNPISSKIPVLLSSGRFFSTLGKVRALSRDGLTWKVVDDNRVVSKLQNGDFDAWASVQAISANPKSLGIVLSGTDIRFMDESTSMVIPTPGVVAFSEVFPLIDSFMYGRWSWDFGGSGRVTELFDLSTGAVAPGGIANTQLDPMPRSTYQDVLFLEYHEAGGILTTAVDVWSAKNGLLATVTRAGTDLSIPSAGASKLNYYVFDVEKLVNPDAIIGVYKVSGILNENNVLSYTVQHTNTTVLGGAAGLFFPTDGHAGFEPPTITQNKAYAAFFKGTAFGILTLLIVDENGVVSTLDTNYPDSSVAATALISAGTKNHAWWVVGVNDFGANTTTFRFYNETGLIHTTSPVAPAATPSVFTIAGTTATDVFVRVILNNVERIIGSDGTFFKPGDVLPSWVTLSVTDNEITDSGKVYTLRKGTGNDPSDNPDLGVIQTMHHIANNAETPSAPLLYRYLIPSGSPNITLPRRSTIQSIQERED